MVGVGGEYTGWGGWLGWVVWVGGLGGWSDLKAYLRAHFRAIPI